jgi:hypothetical protein
MIKLDGLEIDNDHFDRNYSKPELDAFATHYFRMFSDNKHGIPAKSLTNLSSSLIHDPKMPSQLLLHNYGNSEGAPLLKQISALSAIQKIELNFDDASQNNNQGITKTMQEMDCLPKQAKVTIKVYNVMI